VMPPTHNSSSAPQGAIGRRIYNGSVPGIIGRDVAGMIEKGPAAAGNVGRDMGERTACPKLAVPIGRLPRAHG